MDRPEKLATLMEKLQNRLDLEKIFGVERELMSFLKSLTQKDLRELYEYIAERTIHCELLQGQRAVCARCPYMRSYAHPNLIEFSCNRKKGLVMLFKFDEGNWIDESNMTNCSWLRAEIKKKGGGV